MATSDDNLPLDLRDYRHAARLFTDANQQFAPKFKFLYHVFFNINQGALVNPALVGVYRNEIGLLVKNTQLPNFEIKTETINQYNRKRNIQTHISYKPITIKFHEDNLGLINQLWQNYYQYHFADMDSAKGSGTTPSLSNLGGMSGLSKLASAASGGVAGLIGGIGGMLGLGGGSGGSGGGAYAKNATTKASGAQYGLKGINASFFNYITISQLGQHKYVSYKLINPTIASWNYENADYAKGNETSEHTMQLNYEAVVFDSGSISVDSPEGFGKVHYDTGISPNMMATPSTPPQVSATTPVTATNQDNTQNTLQTINNYQNSQSGQLAGALSNATSLAAQTTGGLQGFSFPTK